VKVRIPTLIRRPKALRTTLRQALAELSGKTRLQLIDDRYKKFRAMGLSSRRHEESGHHRNRVRCDRDRRNRFFHLNLAKFRVEVCMEYKGRTNCRTASGSTKDLHCAPPFRMRALTSLPV